MTKTIPPYRLPLFNYWANQKIDEYFDLYPDDFRGNPAVTPRKGVPPGQKYPFSLTKYQVAVYSVLHGQKLSKFSLETILEFVHSKPSIGLFRVWRSEKRFKLLVGELRAQFARHVAENIIFGKAGDYDSYEPRTPITGLIRKIKFIEEAGNYSPDLMEKISVEMSKLIVSNDKMRSVDDYLGHHIWCIEMLYFPNNFGKKSRQRAILLNVCKKIVGHHWQDKFLPNYLAENTPVAWRTMVPGFSRFYLDSKSVDYFLERGDFGTVQDTYREEFAAMINLKLIKLSGSENTIEIKRDIMVGINFLANKYKFLSSQVS